MRPTSFRLGALLAAGVLAVHELRYRVLDAEAGAGAAEAGHGYLGALTAGTGVVLVLALGHLVQLWAAGRRDHARARGHALWLAASGAVLAGYVGQELVAGWLSSGHPAGLAGLLAHGGWVAVPLSVACGGVIALVVRSVTAVLRHRAITVGRPRSWAAQIDFSDPPALLPARGRRQVRHQSGRSPPAVALQ